MPPTTRDWTPAPRRRERRWLAPFCYLALFLGFLWFVLPFAAPVPEALCGEAATSPVLLDRDGTPIHHLTLPDFSRAAPLALDQIPRELVDATLAAEDRRFFTHGGIDFLATARAVRDLVRHHRAVSGASTITQQLVKISSPPAPRTIATKLREMLVARRLEMTWSKQRILAAYLDLLDYGNLRKGPAEAARFYFQKPLTDLSLAESALLAGLPQAPSRLDPLRHPTRARARRDVVLDRLAGRFHYDESRIARACAEDFQLRPLHEATHAPWLTAALLSAPGDSIRTSISLPLQQDAEQIVREELAPLADRNLHHAAVVVVNNPTGEILALVSSGDWHDPNGGQMNGALVPRSPGSTLKPFTYLLAFEHLDLFPGAIIADIPTRFRTIDGLDAPENYDHTWHGPITIRRALACSINVAAMRQLNALGGPKPLHELLTSLGFDTIGPSAAPYGLGLTLGNAPVRLADLAGAYATLARGGVPLPLTLLADPDLAPPSPPLFSRESAFLIADILSDPAARAPAFGPAPTLRLPFPCAVKTGTSSDYRDNWCVGFTNDLTVAVWAGNFDHSPMKHISGIDGAGPIFRRVMLRAHQDIPPTWFEPPSTLVHVTIDPRTGKRVPDHPAVQPTEQANDWCPADRLPLPVADTDYDHDGRVMLDIAFREWFDSAASADRRRFVIADSLPSSQPLRVLAPHNGATYYLDPELPSGGKHLRLATTLPGTAVWTSPTLQIEPTVPEPTVILTPGTHTLTATDPRSHESQVLTIHVESL